MSLLRSGLSLKQRRFFLISLFLGILLGIGSLFGFIRGFRLSQTDYMLVLTFHGVTDTPEKPWEITMAKLTGYLNGFRQYGFTPIKPEEFGEWQAGKLPSGRRFLVTFDDGLTTSGKAMHELLRQRGLHSVLFIVTDLVGTSGYLSWTEIKALADAGCLIGLHGKRHEELPLLHERGISLTQEIAAARQALRENLGAAPTWFAYPFGVHNQTVRNLIASSGLSLAFTIAGTSIERGQDSFLLPRIMYLRGVEQSGEPTIDEWIPPEEIRQSGLMLTLSLLISIWSIGLLFRAFRFTRFAEHTVDKKMEEPTHERP
jgi:peptidoglycan/xylan/chitin deacetylase (PgdA/CDA1 family)